MSCWRSCAAASTSKFVKLTEASRVSSDEQVIEHGRTKRLQWSCFKSNTLPCNIYDGLWTPHDDLGLAGAFRLVRSCIGALVAAQNGSVLCMQ